MTELIPEVGSSFALPKPAFDQLLTILRSMGYITTGPVVQNEVITYAQIDEVLNRLEDTLADVVKKRSAS